MEKQYEQDKRRQRNLEKAKKLAQQATKNGIRITFSAKPEKNELDFEKNLRKAFK